MTSHTNSQNRVPDLLALRAAHKDSYPVGNRGHGTPENPEWGTFCMECKQSWPCDVSVLLDYISSHINYAQVVEEVTHACPPKGSGIMPCCGQTPFEVLRPSDRMTTDPKLVTCGAIEERTEDV